MSRFTLRGIAAAAAATATLLASILGGAVSPALAAPQAASAGESYSISGTIYLGNSSTPATTGAVNVYWSRDSHEIDPSRMVQTDASGAYSITGLESGTYTTGLYYLYVDYLGSDTFESKWMGETALVTEPTNGIYVIGGSRLEVNSTLLKFGAIEGTVYLGSTGVTVPAGDASVHFEAPVGNGNYYVSESVAVDAAGHYSFTDVPQGGSYQLFIDYEGSGDFQSGWLGSSTTIVQFRHQALNTYVGALPGVVRNAVLPATMALSGVVSLGTADVLAGAGAVDVALEYYDSTNATWHAVATTTTGADGSYSFTGLLNVGYRAIFTYTGTDGQFATTSVRGSATGSAPSANWNMTIAAGHLVSGVVRLEGFGFPADADEVTVEFWNQGTLAATAVTGDRGDWAVAGLPTGEYTVTFTYMGYMDYSDAEISGLYVDSDSSGVDMMLPRQGRILVTLNAPALAPSDYNGYVNAFLFTYDFDLEEWVEVEAEKNDFRTPDDGIAFLGLEYGYYAVLVEYDGPKGYKVHASPVYLVEPGSVDSFTGTITFDISSDYSGDGASDVLARDSTGGLWMYRGNGDSGWAGGSKVGTGWNGFNLVFDAGDFSGDGYPDVIARTPSGDLYLYRGNGSGGWLGASKIGTGWNGFNAVFGVGDFSGDGNPDVMTRTPNGDLYLYRGNGAGGWAGSGKIGSGWNGFDTIFGVGDFSDDGNPDVMARTPAGALYLYRGNGDSGWSSNAKIGSGWNGFNAVFGVGDFSGDGLADVMTRTAGGDLYLYRGNGDSGWAGSGKIGSGWGPLSIVQ